MLNDASLNYLRSITEFEKGDLKYAGSQIDR